MVKTGDVIELQLIVFTLMGMGIALTKLKIITKPGRSCMTDLLINVILPCNVINSFLIKMSFSIFIKTIWAFFIALGIQLVSYLLGKVLYHFTDSSKKKVLQYATMCSNAGFMGNPIIEGLYGPGGLLYASVYLIPLRVFMWSAGLACFTSVDKKDALKKLALHPCIIAVWIGALLLVTQAPLPSFMGKTIKYISNCTLPVSIIIIGSILAEVNFRRIASRLTLYYSAIRLLAIPLITLLICRLFQADLLITGVSVILAGMPAGSTTAILAEKYGGDAPFASKCVFISTLLSMVTIPLLCLLMEKTML